MPNNLSSSPIRNWSCCHCQIIYCKSVRPSFAIFSDICSVLCLHRCSILPSRTVQYGM